MNVESRGPRSHGSKFTGGMFIRIDDARVSKLKDRTMSVESIVEFKCVLEGARGECREFEFEENA